MNLNDLNQLPAAKAREEFLRCCGSTNWAEAMVNGRPFRDAEQLYQVADVVWRKLAPDDWLEAFAAHPQIGDVKDLEKKFSRTKEWSLSEQNTVQNADAKTLTALAQGNQNYLMKFGFIFIVCATGKSAAEMLDLLNKRLLGSKEQELEQAAREQSKITRIRLEKLLS